MLASFCNGSVIHHRMTPKKHRFKYNMSWCLFDLDTLDDLCNQSLFWSVNKFNVVSVRNKDYINDKNDSIKSKVIDYLKQQHSVDFNGRVMLFTHPRFLGFGFNSVNFYLCFQDSKLYAIISEINNTPWKQKHLYFHDCRSINNQQHTQEYIFEFEKEFHISPFVDMAIDYTWQFKVNSDNFSVQMHLLKDNTQIMNVSLNTQLQPILSTGLNKWMLKKPFQALKMIAGIYWQASKLWFKKVPFFTHPNNNEVKQ